MKKRTISLLLAALMLLSVGFTTAAAADEGITPRYQPCLVCREGVIRTRSSTRPIGNSPIDYLEHAIDDYLYACPIYATQTTYTEECDNPQCGYIYRTWTEDGTKVVHKH